MSKHTPGPWHRSGARVESDDGALIAGVYDGSKSNDYSRETEIANANLIATSPELLEALEAVTNTYAERMYDERSCKEEDLPEVMAARKVIAKARGES